MLQQSTCGCRVDPLWLNLGVILLITLPIGLRRRRPVLVFFLTGLAFLHVLLGFTNQFLDTFAVLVALFSVANYAPWSLSVLAAASAALALPLNFLIDWTNHGRIDLSDIPYNYALFGAAWILGDNLRQRRERERELEQRAVQLQHAVSVIVLQARARDHVRRRAGGRFERGRRLRVRALLPVEASPA